MPLNLSAPSCTFSIAWWIAIVLAPVAFAAELTSPSPSPDGLAFFEKRIRPVLAESCYKCHSAEAKAQGKLKGGLFLDTREGVLVGGDTGPSIVLGKPDASLLVKAMRWSDPDMEMPPKTKLPEAVIADFAKWVEMGAPDPRTGAKGSAKREIDITQGRGFRSFMPLARVSPPAVKNAAWVRSPVDRFILAKQEEAGVTPSAAVSREKLARRAFFDLTGLPPSPEELDAFLKDQSPAAFGKLVDRLLASPQYGERWGRHWLDVVRFAESGGYEFDGFRPGAYHYRDWVIRALNDDMPYTDFVRWQLAGDKIQPGTYAGAAATGFLVAGPYPGQTTAKTLERIRYDQLDDMLSTIGNSMLGLTLECVRCHEHKYDPVPHADYYALAATLAKTQHGKQSLDPDPAATKAAIEAHRTTGESLVAALRKFEKEEVPARLETVRKDGALKTASDARWQTLDVIEVDGDKVRLESGTDGVVTFAERTNSRLKRPGAAAAQGAENPKDLAYVIVAHTYQQHLTAVRLDVFPDKKFPKSGPGLAGDGSFNLTEFSVTASPLNTEDTAPPVTLKLTAGQARFAEKEMPVAHALDGNPATGWRAKDNPGVENAAVFAIEGGFPGFKGGTVLTFRLDFRADPIGRLRLAMSNAPLPANTSAAEGKPDAAGSDVFAGKIDFQHMMELRAMADGKLIDANRPDAVRWLSRLDEPSRKVFHAVADYPRQPPKPKLADVYTTVAGGQDVFLLRRGDVASKEGKAGPGFIQVLATTAPDRWLGQPAREPRVALGEWMTDSEGGAGHLLARVIVNRLWKHHFGRGIVATPNDFGAQGAAPTHPELLDYLAGELIRGGWKLKPLHRLMMLTSTYQQGADMNARNQQRDPDNKLLWQRPARRLEAEAIRDALLSVGEKLDPRMFGPSETGVESPRRSVYLKVQRSGLIPFLTLFDAPDATHSIGDRGATTVPTQALTVMNSPFVRDIAGRLAKRALPKDAAPEAVIDNVFRIAFSRMPTDAERAKFSGYFLRLKESMGGADPKLAAQATEKALAAICRVALAMNEFIYID